MWCRALLLSVFCSAVFGQQQVETDAAVAVASSLRWLLDRRDAEGGWGTDTAKAVLAVALLNDSALVGLERTVTLKELEINLLADLWRHRDFPLTASRLSEYVLAMVSLCADVRRFQGRDLTAVLQHHRTGPDYESAYAVLATCAARAPVRRRSYERLLTVAASRPELHGTDTLALTVLALRCVADHSSQHVEKHMQTPLMALLERQRPDGGFGNLFSTLLAIQALRSELISGWNETSAVASVLHRGNKEGLLGSLFDTAGALPVLAGKSLLDVAETSCHRPPPDPTVSAAEVSPVDTADDDEDDDTLKSVDGSDAVKDRQSEADFVKDEVDNMAAEITKELSATTEPAEVPTTDPPSSERLSNSSLHIVTLWLWIGANIEEKHTIRLEVPANTSLFGCMQLAAERDQHFRFSAEVWPNGHYIHTIDGRSEQKDGYHFWMLYSLSGPPDADQKPGSEHVHKTGVDSLFPSDDSHVLFWYKEL